MPERLLVVATTNIHKVREIAAIASGFGYRAVSRAEAGLPDADVPEDGATFEENSLAKARAIRMWLSERAFPITISARQGPMSACRGAEGAHAAFPPSLPAVIADDSGLEVDALGGAPGVYSARFADPGDPSDAADFEEASRIAARDAGQAARGVQDLANNAKLLRLLAERGAPAQGRAARFVSAIALIMPDGSEHTFRGEVAGAIGHAHVGANGFGYDPLFTPDGHSRTFGMFPFEEKNRISHRSAALAKLSAFLRGQEKE